jgi:hypothetical protein
MELTAASKPIVDCNMSCLSIDEKRLRAILKNGIVNVSKSELRSNPKKYAVEYQYSGKILSYGSYTKQKSFNGNFCNQTL